MIVWSAICTYPDKKAFMFYTKAFIVDHWSNLEAIAQEVVNKEWGKISPHPPPNIVELVPGHIEYIKEEQR